MFEEVPALSPLSFFSFKIPCFYSKSSLLGKKHLLPSFSDWLEEEEFAKVFFAWNEEELILNAEVQTSYETSAFPDYRKGDCIELFIDTRDLKQKTTVGRFCHHFVFFPEKVLNAFGREVTRFRADDMHPLCNPDDFMVEAEILPSHYRIHVQIPKNCLTEYDPKGLPRIGFAYQIHRCGQPSQHFNISSFEMEIEDNPHLWATLKLIE
jgi:hypothetical protein